MEENGCRESWGETIRKRPRRCTAKKPSLAESDSEDGLEFKRKLIPDNSFGGCSLDEKSAADEEKASKTSTDLGVMVPVGMSFQPMPSLHLDVDTNESGDDEESECIDEGESRNNLYWCKKTQEACLWYGGDDEVGLYDMIEVLPFFQEKVDEKIVKRCEIVPLEGDSHYSNKNRGAFCAALLDFPEWSFHERASFIWPHNLTKIMSDNKYFERFSNFLRSLGLHESMFDDDLSKLYLFGLCADQSGLLTECFSESLISRRCSEDIMHLFDLVMKFKDNQEKDFRRSSSRVDPDFQVSDSEIPYLVPTRRQITIENYKRSKSNREKDNIFGELKQCCDNAVHITNLKDDVVKMEEYLEKVAHMQLILPGHVVYIDDLSPEKKRNNYAVIIGIEHSSSSSSSPQNFFNLTNLYSSADTLSLAEIKRRNSSIVITVYNGNIALSIPGSSLSTTIYPILYF